MIESVQARQRGAYNFSDHYDNLCALQDSVPLPSVKAHLAQGVIDLNGDRIRLTDWQPIINSIKINKSLQFIAVRSYYQIPPEEDAKRAAILKRKMPSIRSKEITHRLMKALKDCLFVSPTLSCIELQGLALRDRDLQVLVKGISKSPTLRHLSLEYCRIGDQSLEVLCKGLKNTKNINSVNLTGCSLSPRGAEALAAVIKHQGMQRHNEAWRDSLRYRRPDLDRMSGIRRITANNNPMLGDDGARLLADALKDDLWLKALDLQSCGVGVSGAKTFLEVLKYNTTLVVLDLRRNPLIGRDMLHSVMEQLMLNSNGQDGEYKWMTATEPDIEAVKSPMKAPLKPRRRATKVLNASIGRKTTIKVTPTAARGKLRNGGVARKFEVQPSPGFPWRTAARANRFRGHPPDKSRFLSSPDVSTSLLFTNTNKNNDGGSGSDREAVVVKSGPSPMKHTEPDSGVALKKLEESHMSLDLTNQKEVLIELEQMRRRLREERLSRAKADQQIVQLMLENHRLEGMLEKLEKGRSPSRRILEDEKFLESIETSFKQFHAFIDMLKEAGLGQLVSMAGLDQSQMPFGSSSSVKNHYENLPEPGMVHISRLTSDGHAQTNGQRTAIVTSVPPHQGSNVYSDEGELARQEADELYTKLVRETQSAIKDTAPRDTTWMRSSAVAKSGVGRSEPGDAHFQNHGDQGVDSRQEHRGQSRIDESINFSVGESRDNESANLSVEQSSYGGEERHSVVDKDDSADDEDF